MNDLVAPSDSIEHSLPFPFDICPVGVEVSLEPCFRENPLAGRDILGNRQPDP